MATAGPKYAGTVTGDSSNGGTVAWTNPQNAQGVADSVFTTVPDTAGSAGVVKTHNLKAVGFGFTGADIRQGSTILGIFLEINAKASPTASLGMKDNAIQLLKAGAGAGSNKATGATVGAAASWIPYGSSSDLWGTTWTQTDVTDANFGAIGAWQVGALLKDTYATYVDAMRITITFTPGATLFRSRSAPDGLGTGGSKFIDPLTTCKRILAVMSTLYLAGGNVTKRVRQVRPLLSEAA